MGGIPPGEKQGTTPGRSRKPKPANYGGLTGGKIKKAKAEAFSATRAKRGNLRRKENYHP